MRELKGDHLRMNELGANAEELIRKFADGCIRKIKVGEKIDYPQIVRITHKPTPWSIRMQLVAVTVEEHGPIVMKLITEKEAIQIAQEIRRVQDERDYQTAKELENEL